ncbi:peptidyl-prolyl cis-trans isomerase C [Salmonella enterica subsp. enterica serovar Havana]|nr:peptidyl-prolyl cis-trans isomerase C [Salmonella enterica subsp. enterica serovar Havana]
MAKMAAALHILVKEEKLALDLLEQIKNGGDFEKLAKKHSICPSGKKRRSFRRISSGPDGSGIR